MLDTRADLAISFLQVYVQHLFCLTTEAEGEAMHFQGRQHCQKCPHPPLLKRGPPKGNKIKPRVAYSYLLEQVPFPQVNSVQANRQEVTTVVSLVNTGGKSVRLLDQGC